MAAVEAAASREICSKGDDRQRFGFSRGISTVKFINGVGTGF